jgi:hypothetical protein
MVLLLGQVDATGTAFPAPRLVLISNAGRCCRLAQTGEARHRPEAVFQSAAARHGVPAYFTTGSPASRQPRKPPAIDQTFV